MFWIMGGPALMMILAAFMIQRESNWYPPTSVAFLVVTVTVVFARRLDPLNGYGEPTSPEELRKHSIATLGLGLVLSIVANALGGR
jgi:hypothetical protein